MHRSVTNGSAAAAGYTAPYFKEAVLPWENHTASVRMNALLDYAGSPLVRKIDATDDLLVLADDLFTYSSVLEYFFKLAESENASFFINSVGEVVFQSRKNKTVAAKPVLAFSNVDRGAGSPPPPSFPAIQTVLVDELEPIFTNREIVNEAQVSNRGGTTYIASDLFNQFENEIVSYSLDNLLYQDEQLSIDLGRFFVGRNDKRSKKNFASVRAKGNGKVGDTTAILKVGLGEPVLIRHYLAKKTSPIDRLEVVQGIQREIGKRFVSVQFELVSTDGIDYFTVGTSTLDSTDVLGV